MSRIDDHDIDSLDLLLDRLDSGSTGLLHFACHNGYSVESGGSFIRMAGGNFVPALLNYASLLAGESLGTAGLKARRTIEDPADPSWLAYTIYGNPNAVATGK